MTLLSTLFPYVTILKGRKWFKVAGNFDYAVPTGAFWCKAVLVGCGGFGDQPPGGGAYVRHRFPVTPAENLKVQVGNTSTASNIGDSYVARNDGTIIAYADRGRGNGTPGQASLSVGELRRDGYPTVGPGGSSLTYGRAGDDTSEEIEYFGPSQGARSGTEQAYRVTAGGGGRIEYVNFSEGLGRTGEPGGYGLVLLEFTDVKPAL